MHRLVAMLLAAALASTSAHSQTGTVASTQRIAAFEGGLNTPLEGRFGYVADTIGDVDGDGTVDLAVGAPGLYPQIPGGAVWILLLNPDGTVRAHRRINDSEVGVTGGFPNTDFGASVAGLGDLDGDGRQELAVCAPRADGGKGLLVILSLERDGRVARQVLIGDGLGGLTMSFANLTFFAESVTALGDVNGDGVTDIAVGSPEFAPAGRVDVLFLAPDGTVIGNAPLHQSAGGAIAGTLPGFGQFGQAVAGLGDRDGNGVPDLAVGTVRGPDSTIRILHLASDGTALDVELLPTVAPLGNALASIPDVDGDGNDDLLAAELDDWALYQETWLFFLEADGSQRGLQRLTARNFLQSTATSDRFGLAGLGDLDGDAKQEIVVGSSWENALYVVELDDSGFLPPVASFSFLPFFTSTQRFTTQVIDESTNNVSTWEWDFGDGSPTTNQTDPYHEYRTPAAPTTVTLTVTGLGGTDTTQRTLLLSAATFQVVNGSGTNPMCFGGWLPVLDDTWRPWVDTTANPFSPLAILLVHATPSSGTFFQGQELLVDLSSPRYLSRTIPATAGKNYFTIEIPLELSLVGVSAAVQGAYMRPIGALTLCNGALMTAGF